MTPPPERRHPTSDQDIKIQKSLIACWKEGISAQVMIGIMDNYLTPFALLIGATNPQVGLLVAIPNFLSAVTQFAAVWAVKFAGSRLRLLLNGMFFQAIFILPIGFLSYTSFPEKMTVLIALVAIYKSIGSLITPAWGSLVSDYLPPHRRGHYFGWRARVTGIANLINIGLWGVFLYSWHRFFDEASGFLILFMVAGIARFVSVWYMSQMAELPIHHTPESEFTFWMFVKRFKESNFVKYIFFVSSITFATNISAPYFSVYMLRDLQFDYLSYMAVTLASLFSGLISFPIWGRHADVVGNARILKITGLFVPIIPILWLFPQHVILLVLIEIFAGFMWGGFNLCAINFVYDAVSPAKRVRCLGYFNLFNGVAIFAGAWLGGYLSTHLPTWRGTTLLWLFVISAVGRLLAFVLFARHFKEVRSEAKSASSMDLFFSVAGIRPLLGRGTDIPASPDASQSTFGKRP